MKDSLYNYFESKFSDEVDNYEEDIRGNYNENKIENDIKKNEKIKKKSIREEYGIKENNYTDSKSLKQESENNSDSFSIDNKGRKLTKEQQDFFKDSKVRDKDGNLLVMYHGTKNGDFTIFNSNKIGSGATSFASNGSGFYFTENKNMAQITLYNNYT